MDSTGEKSTALPVLDYAPTPSALPWGRIAIITALVVFSFLTIVEGFKLRRYEFEQTKSIRYLGDVSNGYGWGQVGAQNGLFRIYDLKAADKIRNYPNELDYTPLRLTIVTLWARWANTYFPNMTRWQNDYDLTKPMLMANTTAELFSSILVFLLVRHWVVRMDDATRSPLEPRRPFRGVTRGMIAALLFWFNPAVIINGHGFPQWDVWNTPFFLGAVLLGCLDWWFAAGCCVVVGAFLKGQILLVAPIFLIWPIVQLRWSAVLRFIAGFTLIGGAIALPWMRPNGAEILWLVLMLTALALVTPIALRWQLNPAWYSSLGVIALLLAWPWGSTSSFTYRCIPIWIVSLVAGARFIPPRLVPHVFALAVAGALLLLIPLFNASSNWYRIGF